MKKTKKFQNYLSSATEFSQSVSRPIRHNLRYIISLLILFLIGFESVAQTDSLKNVNPSFITMLVGTKNIYALSSSGQFFTWDLEKLKRTFTSDKMVKYTTIAKDKANNIYLGTANGSIFRFDENDYSFDLYLKLKKNYNITDIFFNSENEIFLIIPYAIYDPIKDKIWTKFKHEKNGVIVAKRFLFFFWKRTNQYFEMPQYTFIDSQDRIWMTKSYGEFGGSLQIFDTRKRTELNTRIDSINFGLLFPKSVFEDKDQTIYITSGLEHFRKSGEIFKIKNNLATKIYDSEDFKDTLEANSIDKGLFIGPGAFNAFDNKIYFATTEGFYRASIPSEGKIENLELIFEIELLWDREPLAIGRSMSIKRLEFTKDNRLVFLTSNNGIGIYDGIKLTMIK